MPLAVELHSKSGQALPASATCSQYKAVDTQLPSQSYPPRQSDSDEAVIILTDSDSDGASMDMSIDDDDWLPDFSDDDSDGASEDTGFDYWVKNKDQGDIHVLNSKECPIILSDTDDDEDSKSFNGTNSHPIHVLRSTASEPPNSTITTSSSVDWEHFSSHSSRINSEPTIGSSRMKSLPYRRTRDLDRRCYSLEPTDLYARRRSAGLPNETLCSDRNNIKPRDQKPLKILTHHVFPGANSLSREPSSGEPSPRTPSPPSADMEGPTTTYCEWDLPGAVLKHAIIDGHSHYQLQWPSCSRYSKKLATLAKKETRHASRASSSTSSRASQVNRRRIKFSDEEDEYLIKLKKKGYSWLEIHDRFSEIHPGRSCGTLQVRYSTKLQHRSEKLQHRPDVTHTDYSYALHYKKKR